MVVWSFLTIAPYGEGGNVVGHKTRLLTAHLSLAQISHFVLTTFTFLIQQVVVILILFVLAHDIA